MATKKKKKARRKPKGTVRKARPRAKVVASGDIGYRERKLKEAIAESRLQADVDEVRGYFPEGELTAEDAAGAVDALAAAPLPTMADPYYGSEPHVVGEPNTHEEILASDNAVIRDRYIASLPRPPEHRVYVPPPPAGAPTLPDLAGVTLEFHTTRCFTWIDLAFALLPEAGVVIRRSHDRLNGGATYLLAGAADLDEHQYGGEIGSHHWYEATDEQHDAIAACDPDAAPLPFEEAAGVAQ